MEPSYSKAPLFSDLHREAQAVARLTGSESFPGLTGAVWFCQTGLGVIICAEVSGLPHAALPCQERIFGFHIHQGDACEGSPEDPFSATMSHYDPEGCPHPYHSGDLPPLFGNDGLALSIFLTNRFSVEEIIGKTVLIHDQPDDFTTQPSGNSGRKIACGVIKKRPSLGR